MKKLWLFILITIVFISCKTPTHVDKTVIDSTEITVPITNTKIEYRDRLLYDSIYIHDSISTLIKGDTVYIYKNKETNHLINKVDTFIKTDTIKVPITITNTVTKTETQVKEVNKLYWWQRVLICLGLTVLIFGVISIIRKTKKTILI